MKRAIIVHIAAGKTVCGECVYKTLNYIRNTGYVCTNPEFSLYGSLSHPLKDKHRLPECLEAERAVDPWKRRKQP